MSLEIRDIADGFAVYENGRKIGKFRYFSAKPYPINKKRMKDLAARLSGSIATIYPEISVASGDIKKV